MHTVIVKVYLSVFVFSLALKDSHNCTIEDYINLSFVTVKSSELHCLSSRIQLIEYVTKRHP